MILYEKCNLPVIFCIQKKRTGLFYTPHQHLLHLLPNNYLVSAHAALTVHLTNIKELTKNDTKNSNYWFTVPLILLENNSSCYSLML